MPRAGVNDQSLAASTRPGEVETDVYRAVSHWEGPAIVEHDGIHYPARLAASVVAHYSVNGTEEDTGERVWAGELLGFPPGLGGDVTIRLLAGDPVAARLTTAGGITGTGVPWLPIERPPLDDHLGSGRTSTR